MYSGPKGFKFKQSSKLDCSQVTFIVKQNPLVVCFDIAIIWGFMSSGTEFLCSFVAGTVNRR